MRLHVVIGGLGMVTQSLSTAGLLTMGDVKHEREYWARLGRRRGLGGA